MRNRGKDGEEGGVTISENRVFAQQLAVAKSTLWARVEREVRMPQPAAKSQTKSKRRQAHVFFLPLSENMPAPICPAA